MKNLKTHFTASSQVAMESFDEGEAVVLGNTEAFAAQYARDEAADGRALENVVDAVDTAVNDAASLEALIEAIDEARDVGMEAGSAQFAKLQMDVLHSRYQISGTESAMPSLECFDGRQARLATTVSLESARETLAKIWQWIKEMAARFMVILRDAYQRVTQNIEVLLKDADALKKFVQRNKFESRGSINIGRLAERLHVDGQVPRDCTSSLQKLGQLTRVSEEATDRVRAAVKDAFARKLDGESYHLSPEVLIPSGWVRIPDGRFDPSAWKKAGGNIWASPVLPGGKFVTITTFYGDENASSAIAGGQSFDSKVSVAELQEQPTIDYGFETLSSSEVFTLCQRVQKAITSLLSSRRSLLDHLSNINGDIAQMQRGARGLDENASIPAPARLSAWFFKSNTVFPADLMRAVESRTYDILSAYIQLGKISIPADLRAQFQG